MPHNKSLSRIRVTTASLTHFPSLQVSNALQCFQDSYSGDFETMKCALLCDLDDPTTDAQIKKRDAIVEVLGRFASGELAAAGSGPAQPAGAAAQQTPHAPPNAARPDVLPPEPGEILT